MPKLATTYRDLEPDQMLARIADLEGQRARLEVALSKAHKRARALEVALADLVHQCNNRVPGGGGGVDTEAAEELLKPS